MLPLSMLPLIWAVLAADEGGLVERLQRRDPQAVAELYDLHVGMVFCLILRIVRDSGIAEDLMHPHLCI